MHYYAAQETLLSFSMALSLVLKSDNYKTTCFCFECRVSCQGCNFNIVALEMKTNSLQLFASACARDVSLKINGVLYLLILCKTKGISGDNFIHNYTQ